MSGVTSLTFAQAQVKIQQVDDAMNNAHTLARDMQDITTQMTSGAWLGNQATQFGQKMGQYTDEFNAIVNRLTHVAETGKQNMLTLVNHDA
ncbi:hypothetical protein ACQI5H_20165 [Mycobacterium heidelbergense]|uniref:hypothetical protein n=1 Tax=Mycobacterium heidelbergense TaxID=53376 RepID=UPI003CF13AE6